MHIVFLLSLIRLNDRLLGIEFMLSATLISEVLSDSGHCLDASFITSNCALMPFPSMTRASLCSCFLRLLPIN